MTLFNPLKKFLAAAITMLMMLLTLFSGTGEVHEVKRPEEVKFVFSVLSDAHIEGPDKELRFINTYNVFTKIIDDVKQLEGGNDALVFLGDNTMNGQHIENLIFYGALNSVKPAENIIVAAGNHDLSNGEGSYSEYSQRVISYNNAFFTEGITKPYFYNVINGCYVICLASEDVTVNTMYISDEQIAWLTAILDEAQSNGAPVFVMSHHPANYLEGRAGNELTDILNDYDNLLFFCGHTHATLSPGSVYTLNGVDCINLPKCTEYNPEGESTGIGAQVEVYEDEVLVRIRDFCKGEWLEEYEYSYPIK